MASVHTDKSQQAVLILHQGYVPEKVEQIEIVPIEHKIPI